MAQWEGLPPLISWGVSPHPQRLLEDLPASAAHAFWSYPHGACWGSSLHQWLLLCCLLCPECTLPSPCQYVSPAYPPALTAGAAPLHLRAKPLLPLLSSLCPCSCLYYSARPLCWGWQVKGNLLGHPRDQTVWMIQIHLCSLALKKGSKAEEGTLLALGSVHQFWLWLHSPLYVAESFMHLLLMSGVSNEPRL